MDSLGSTDQRFQNGRRRTRSVLGCLTCRRRRVKCNSRNAPCGNCQRLRITCNPSFHCNFKMWMPDSNSLPPSSLENSDQYLSQWPVLPSSPAHGDPSSAIEASDLLDDASKYDHDNTNGILIQDQQQQQHDFSADDLLMIPEPAVDLSFLTPLSPGTVTLDDTNDYEITESHISSNRPSTMSAWAMPSLMTDDTALLNEQAAKMPWLLTLKQSAWNPYQFMLNTTQKAPNSPLRHAILGWSSAYISCRSKTQLSCMGSWYYVSATDSVAAMLENLVKNITSESSLAPGNLYMLFSTAYFLNSCDLMLSDFSSFYNRMNSIRVAIQQNWTKIKDKLGPLESRLLIWLAHLDTCYSLFSSRGKPENLFSILVGVDAFPFLRSYPEGHSYLSPCFGEEYPQKELEEDLAQEPFHAMCDQIYAIMGRINSFAAWNEQNKWRFGDDDLRRELRIAKIETLQAQIAKVRAECALLMREHQDSEGINRSSFHFLTVKTFHQSAMIMLNRVVNPDVRTDPESELAAKQIILITQRLLKANYLRLPRASHTWLLPIYIAGIETTDVIYQDWIITFFTELESLGAHISKTKELLEKIITEQQKNGKRIQNVMESFDSVFL